VSFLSIYIDIKEKKLFLSYKRMSDVTVFWREKESRDINEII